MRFCKLIILCLTALFLGSGAVYSGSPISIRTAMELEEFAKKVNAGDSTLNAILLADIDYTKHQTLIGWDLPYAGNFDGKGHKIKVEFKDIEYNDCALFRYISNGATIKNLHVDGTISTKGRYAAGIVADLEGANIVNCLSTVNIFSSYSGDCTLGGIVGFAKQKNEIRNCVYAGDIEAPNGERVGGMVGWVDEETTLIQNCLVICNAQLGSLENSNSVARSLKPEYLVLDNVHYVNDINTTHLGAEKVSMEEILRGETYYRMFENELRDAERELADKAKRLELTNYFILGAVSVLIIQAVLLFLLNVRNRRNRRKLQQQYEDLERVKAQLAAVTHPINYPTDGESKQDATIHVEKEPASREDTTVIPKEESLSSANMQILYNRTLSVMSEKQLYTDPKLSLADLAMEVCTNQSRLSQCVNKMSGQNFNTWLGQYRVSHAMKLMDENPDISEEELMTRSGFASHASYYRIFHKVTGYSPKQYLRIRTIKKEVT